MIKILVTASSDIIDQPERVVVPGDDTTFTCYTAIFGPIEQFKWLVNGTRLEDLNQTEGIDAENNFFGHLNFISIPVEYNSTTIQCIIDFTSGESVSSNNATLLVQGKEKNNILT